MSVPSGQTERRFKGIPVSQGIARGKAYVHYEDDDDPPPREIAENEIAGELKRFEEALLATRKQILEMQRQIEKAIGEKNAQIFDAHLLVVEDSAIIDEVVRRVNKERLNIEFVFHEVAERYRNTLSALDDPYLRERAVDIHDVSRRVLRNLQGKENKSLTHLKEPYICIARNLTPSDMALIDRNLARGLATDVGSKTSHTAILARSLGIPSVVGLRNASEILKSGDDALLDGYNGFLIVNPSEQTLREYGELAGKKQALDETLVTLRDTVATTKDGRRIILSANIELPEEVEQVTQNGAEGIGLYRTEFFYLNKDELPDEDLQYENYLRVANAVQPHPVIIRTLDLGGDKFMGALQMPEELNPFLGWRAIRFCLERLDIFKTQLRAILRASAAGNVRIMYPMISGLGELKRANEVLEECRAELRAEGKPFDEALEVGAMIEIPSAALTADLLAPHVHFFSIGTNDLIQYSIAVDRGNERISHLYKPTHPAIIRLLKTVIQAAHANNIWVGVCGEMAGEIALTPLLVGIGIDELSVSAGLVPRIKRAILNLETGECERLAGEIMSLQTSKDILEKCEAFAHARYPELF